MLELNELTSQNPAWNLLQNQLFHQIFENLQVKDLKSIRLACRQWCDLVEDIFLQKSTLAFENCCFDLKLVPWNVFSQSKLKFSSIKISSEVSSGGEHFWKQIGREVVTLTFDMGDRNLEKEFLSYFPKLKTVAFRRWSDFIFYEFPETIENIELRYMPPTAFVLHEDKGKLERVLKQTKNLKSLTTKALYRTGSEEMEIVTLPEEINYERCLIKPLNLLESRRVNFSDIHGVCLKGDDDLEARILKLPNLQSLELFESQGCVHFHSGLTENFQKVTKLKIISYNDLKKDFPPCQSCIQNLIKSFPNLNNFESNSQFTDWQKLVNGFSRLLISLKTHHFLVLESYKEIQELELTALTQHGFNQIFMKGSLPNLRKIKLKEETNLGIHQFELLLKMCPAMEEARLHSVSFEEILLVEKYWPALKYLNFRRIKLCGSSIEDFLNKLQGKFTRIRTLGTPFTSCGLSKEEKEKFSLILFKKVPTLRESFLVNFDQFCKI